MRVFDISDISVILIHLYCPCPQVNQNGYMKFYRNSLFITKICIFVFTRTIGCLLLVQKPEKETPWGEFMLGPRRVST